jgi:long-chain acyl-CoA synthetase
VNTVNLADVFVGISDRFRDRPAIITSEMRLTFGELIARAARSARELRHRGVEPGANVGLATRENGDAIVAMLAVWMLGATAVPIDFRAKDGERNKFAQEFDLKAIIQDSPPGETASYVSILMNEGWIETIARHDDRPLFHVGPSAPAFISLTSGTTGAPLGIVLDHDRQLFRMLFRHPISHGESAGVLVSATPLSFSGARNHVLSHMLDGGATYFLPPIFSAAEFGEAILQNQAVSVFAVPTIIRGLLDVYGNREALAFSSLRMLFSGGGMIRPEEKQRAKTKLSPYFLDCYSSGLSGWISFLQGEDVDTHADTVGRVLKQVALQIVDPDDNPLPIGEAGAIRVRTPSMARTTYRGVSRPSGDRIRDGWIYPGDIGVVDADRFLRIVGRTSDIINRGGVNVHPSEVEAAILEFSGVREAAVVGFSTIREGEEIAAIVVAGPEVSETALNAHCRKRLTPDKCPRKFVFVSELPRNANGKIARAGLLALVEEKTS